jgi:hypothetical protein
MISASSYPSRQQYFGFLEPQAYGLSWASRSQEAILGESNTGGPGGRNGPGCFVELRGIRPRTVSAPNSIRRIKLLIPILGFSCRPWGVARRSPWAIFRSRGLVPMTAWWAASSISAVSTTQSGLSDFFWRLSRKARNWRLFLVCIFELPGLYPSNPAISALRLWSANSRSWRHAVGVDRKPSGCLRLDRAIGQRSWPQRSRSAIT